jgi:hypothetical protein
MQKQIAISLAIVASIFAITALVIIYGRGYRVRVNEGKPMISGTGLLVATSTPDGAQVFINDQLTTATDNTINLAPGSYKVRIYKEGYFPWEKELRVQEEVVAKAEALLFPTTPKLEGITALGVANPVLDPSLTRIAYTVSSQSNRKNGIYVLDLAALPLLTLSSGSTQVVDDTVDNFSGATISWSPDGREIIATTSSQTTYLLNASDERQAPQNVTFTLSTVQGLWEEEKQDKERARIIGLKAPLKKLISENFNILSWSPDDTKILYEATISATLPLIIKPRLIGAETTTEQREITKGSIYVYDMKEDKNYALGDVSAPQSLVWFPDSQHIVMTHEKRAEVIEFDGTNRTTVYAGPFIGDYVYPWPNGSKLIILTDLGNPTIAPNLYTVSLK